MRLALALDHHLFHVVNGLAGRFGALDAVMIGCARFAPWVFAALLVVLWLFGGRPQRFGLLAFAAALTALGIGQLIGMALPRLRPYEATGLGPVHLLITHAPDTSFPSDHATLALAITTVVWGLDRRLGIASLVFSLWLCFARVFVGAHYPSDVLGGALLGLALGVISLRLSALPRIRASLDWIFAVLHRAHLASAPP